MCGHGLQPCLTLLPCRTAFEPFGSIKPLIGAILDGKRADEVLNVSACLPACLPARLPAACLLWKRMHLSHQGKGRGWEVCLPCARSARLYPLCLLCLLHPGAQFGSVDADAAVIDDTYEPPLVGVSSHPTFRHFLAQSCHQCPHCAMHTGRLLASCHAY